MLYYDKKLYKHVHVTLVSINCKKSVNVTSFLDLYLYVHFHLHPNSVNA